MQKEEVQKIIYRSSESRERFDSVLKRSNPDDFYEKYWKPIALLFSDKRNGAEKIDSVISELFDENSTVRPIIVINLSVDNEGFIEHSTSMGSLFNEDTEHQQEVSILWNEDIQSLVIKRLLEGIRLVAQRAYKNNRSLNSLILMDEAHRLAPREEPENEERKEIRALLIDSARTTRKYGVGWMFISQTLSSLHRENLGLSAN
jgi:DNA helicase HerA-like ATPase